MLTLNDAQELVKNPEKARELAQAMIPEKISKVLEKDIDHALINALAQSKVNVSLVLRENARENHDNIVTYLYLLGMKNPNVKVSTWRSFDDSGSTSEVKFSVPKNEEK